MLFGLALSALSNGGDAASERLQSPMMLNDPPIAVSDTFDVMEGTSAELDVLANDSDPDGDPLDVFILIPPVHGTATAPDLDLVYYTPDPAYVGPDSFRYRICDNGLPVLCADAWVYLNVLSANLPPIARADTAVTVSNFAILVDVLANDEDPEGQPFSSMTIVNPPAQGRTSLNFQRGITYTPHEDYAGIDSFRYRVCDAGSPALCAMARVHLRIDPMQLPDSFSPNGDGMNDTWIIDGVLSYPANSLEIFDRRGARVFYTEGYSNEWDGRFQSDQRELPEDVYFYRFRLLDLNADFSGSIVLRR